MLSNFPFLRGFGSPDERAPVEYRTAQGHELEPAVRLILASASAATDEAQVREFVRLGIAHQGGAGGIYVADQRGRLISAALSIVSPGRTMLLFVPTALSHPFERQTTRNLVEALCRRGAEAGISLAQVLMDVQEEAAQELLRECGFGRLAELLYMQLDAGRAQREPPLGPDLRWETYSAHNHELFARTILASYRQSLDCPALNGLRDIQDVIAGHRATGEFDPRLWFALARGSEGLGVLLLARVPHSDILELVYLGIAPEARGQGIGDLMMRRAVAAVPAAGCTRLSLAVDAGNMPALKLYWRHGMQSMGRKLALMRDLRQR